MPSYKLTYFPLKGRGEVARQLFHLAGVTFEDNRVKFEDWGTLKSQTPFGFLPLLEVDGKPLPESFAINRYLAKEFGFAGQSPFESAWVDAIADQYKDYMEEIRPALIAFYRSGGAEKELLVNDASILARDKYFGLLEKIAKENGSNGHFVGSSLTWVDLLIADHVSIHIKHHPGYFDGFSTVLETVRRIESTPKLAEWIQKRPDTVY